MQIKLKKLPRHKQMEILAWVKATGERASRRPRRPLSRALLSEIVAPPFDPELEDDATAHAGSRASSASSSKPRSATPARYTHSARQTLDAEWPPPGARIR